MLGKQVQLTHIWIKSAVMRNSRLQYFPLNNEYFSRIFVSKEFQNWQIVKGYANNMLMVPHLNLILPHKPLEQEALNS